MAQRKPKLLLLISILTLVSQIPVTTQYYDFLDALSDMLFFLPSTRVILEKAIRISQSVRKITPYLQTNTEIKDHMKLDEILIILQNMSLNVNKIQESIQHQVMTLLPKEIDLDHKMNRIYEHVGKLDYYFHLLLLYADKSRRYENETIQDFRKAVIDPSDCGMRGHLSEIHRLMTKVYSGVDVVQVLASSDQANNLKCKREQSSQHLINTLYNNIVLAEIKGIVMIQYAYSLNRGPNDGIAFETELKQYIIDAWVRISTIIPKFKKYMPFADRDVWKCDAPDYVQGKTFFKIGQPNPSPSVAARQYKKDRCFSLRDVNSDVYENKIITGMKIVLQNGIFFIQVQQGLLVEHGNIMQKTVEWKPVQSFDTSEVGVVVGKDYFHMGWDRIIVNIDSIDAPANRVLTGVGFSQENSRLKLRIRHTPFDFGSGKLNVTETRYFSKWHSGDKDRVEIHYDQALPLMHRNQPMLTRQKAYLEINTFLQKGDGPHAGLNVVPFIDGQEITSTPSTLLSGAGLVYRGATGSAGFITLKAITYDYSSHLETNSSGIEALKDFLSRLDEELKNEIGGN